jgi:GxxExxY protein
MKVETEKIIDLTYKDKKIGVHRLDLVSDNKVVVELKTVERFSIHHKAQLASYLKASGYKLGILVNFSKSKVDGFVKSQPVFFFNNSDKKLVFLL